MKFEDLKQKVKYAALAASLAGMSMLPGMATVIDTDIDVSAVVGASVDAGDTSSLSIAFINTILTALVTRGDVIGSLIVLGILISLITGVFSAFVALFKGIATLGSRINY